MDERGLFAETDAVFAGAGPVHGQGSPDQPRVEFCRRGHLVGIVEVQQQDAVELPSPTWPSIVPGKGVSARSARVSTTHSAKRLIGTQTSVDHGTAPGRSDRAAKPAW